MLPSFSSGKAGKIVLIISIAMVIVSGIAIFITQADGWLIVLCLSMLIAISSGFSQYIARQMAEIGDEAENLTQRTRDTVH